MFMKQDCGQKMWLDQNFMHVGDMVHATIMGHTLTTYYTIVYPRSCWRGSMQEANQHAQASTAYLG